MFPLMGERRAAVSALVAVIGVVLVGVLVTWAASIGPSGTLSGEGVEPVRLTPSESTSGPSDPFTQLRTDEQDDLEARNAGDRPLLRAIALILEIAVALTLLWLLARRARRMYENWKAKQRPAAELLELEFDVLGQPSRVAEEIAKDREVQLAMLRGGSPRNGIVSCWHRFEVQAADVGRAPYSWETPSEFTMRMLTLAGADERALTELAALYGEARFSTHELDEGARERAVAALEALHGTWRSARS